MKILNGGSHEDVALAILIVGAGAGTFASFCPSWFTTRSAFFHEQSHYDGNVKAIRHGEIAGTLITMLEGVAASWLVKSWLPTIGAAFISAIMVGGYEYSILHPAIEDSNDSDTTVQRSAWTFQASK